MKKTGKILVLLCLAQIITLMIVIGVFIIRVGADAKAPQWIVIWIVEGMVCGLSGFILWIIPGFKKWITEFIND
jgi:membrane protein CcdC involved in cytochrome C biogenesis